MIERESISIDLNTVKPKVTKRKWTPAEDAELRAIAEETLNGRRLRGWRDKPMGRLAMFAAKHGRTLAAVKMRAKRMGYHSYFTENKEQGLRTRRCASFDNEA